MNRVELEISSEDLIAIREFLKEKFFPGGCFYKGNRAECGSVVWAISAGFGYGIEADIEVCAGSNNGFMNPVLFLDGEEVCHLIDDDSGEVLGEYDFEYEGDHYIIVLKEAAGS